MRLLSFAFCLLTPILSHADTDIEGKHEHYGHYQKTGARIHVKEPTGLTVQQNVEQSVRVYFEVGNEPGTLSLKLIPQENVVIQSSQTQWQFDLENDEIYVDIGFYSRSAAIEQLSFIAEIDNAGYKQSRVLGVSLIPENPVKASHQTVIQSKVTNEPSMIIQAAQEEIITSTK